MIKKLMLVLAGVLVMAGMAMAAVEVNQASRAELESVKGIGPGIAGKILDERKKGPFRDWGDFQGRVRGIGDKNAAVFAQNGLVVNGQTKPGVTPAPQEGRKAPASMPMKKDGAKEPAKPH